MHVTKLSRFMRFVSATETIYLQGYLKAIWAIIKAVYLDDSSAMMLCLQACLFTCTSEIEFV